MLDLKFRAWKRFRNAFVNGEVAPLSCGLILMKPPIADHFQTQGGVIVEQFIGISDRNGREIYEGDVVSHTNDYGSWKPTSTGAVVWFDKNAAFGIRPIKTEEKWAFYDPEGKNFSWERVVVIGNIHENPELLNREHRDTRPAFGKDPAEPTLEAEL